MSATHTPHPPSRHPRSFLACAAALLIGPSAFAADPPGSLAMDWPMGQHDGTQFIPGQNVRVMQNYGNSNPDYGYRLHSAVDLSYDSGSTIGAPVRAAADGTVACVVNGWYPGSVVVLEHTLSSGAKLYTQYGHLNTSSLALGQVVNRGRQIGTVLQWPDDASNTHLHFEVRTFLNWSGGGCSGPGYAVSGYTPDQQGWLNPIDQYFLRRPEFPGQVTTNFNQNVRNAPNRASGVAIASVPANARVIADGVHADQSGSKDWWHRVEYAPGQWGYLAAYWNYDGWAGDLYSTEFHRYPGPVEPAEVISAGGELYVFARRNDGATLLRRRSAGGAWGAWLSLDGTATSNPAAVVNADGKVQVFVRGVDGNIWTRRQSSAGGAGWDAWAGVGGSATSTPAVVRNSDGRLQLFVRGPSGNLRTRQQASAGGAWNNWVNLGGRLNWGPTAALNSDGRVAVFVGGQNNDVFQIVQGSAGGAFGSYQPLGGSIASHPSVVRNADGRLELFARGAEHDLRHIKQNAAGGGATWGAWQSRGGVITSHPKAALNADGRIEVFARGSEGQLAHVWQTSAGGAWGSWSGLEGYLTSGALVAAQGTTLQLVALGQNGVLWHRGQSGGGWTPYFSLGGTFAPP
jgi:murein DD-endopeptidase MepM/ murein hydrolase activator NlpD